MTTLIIPSTGQTIGAFEAERIIRLKTSCGPVINFEDFGYKVVFPTPRPTFDPITHFCRETAPALSSKGTWEQQWEVIPLDPEQVAANQKQANNSSVLSQIAALEASVTQRRLREATLGTDNGWLAGIDSQIAALRSQLI